MKEPALLRIVDANYNRAKEALRVCEDICRFTLNNRILTGKLRRERHSLTKIILSPPFAYGNMIKSRDSENDIGRRNSIYHNGKFGSSDIFARNIQRAEEATRVLEEVGKAFSHRSARGFQKIRFSLYELEKKAYTKLTK